MTGRAALSGRLKALIRSSGHFATGVSRQLRLHPGYLTKAFNGALALKLKHVLGVLAAVGEPAHRFFGRHYPPPPSRRAGSAGVADRRAEVELVLRSLLGGDDTEEVPEPAAVEARAGQILRGRIAEAGTSQRSVSRALKLPKDQLGRALRGEKDLQPTLFTSLLLRGRNYLDLLRYPAPPLLNVR
jgi:hypothetical protein